MGTCQTVTYDITCGNVWKHYMFRQVIEKLYCFDIKCTIWYLHSVSTITVM